MSSKHRRILYSDLNCGLITFKCGAKRYFCNIASVGISSLVLQSMSKYRRLSSAIKASPLRSVSYFVWTIFLLIFSVRWKEIELQCSSSNFKESSIFACISIGSCFGGGISVSPSSDPSNPNASYLQVVKKFRWLNFLLLPLLMLTFPFCMMLRLLKCHVPLHFLSYEYKYSDKIFLSSNAVDIAIECDGEVVGELPVTVEVLPQSLPWMSFR